jgi:hypothetical protein
VFDGLEVAEGGSVEFDLDSFVGESDEFDMGGETGAIVVVAKLGVIVGGFMGDWPGRKEGGNDGSSLGNGDAVGWGESRTDGSSDGSEDGPEVFPVGLGVEAGSLVGGELGFKEGTADCEGGIVDKPDGDQEFLSVSLSPSLDGDPEVSRRFSSGLGLKDGVEAEGVEVGRNEGSSDALDDASSLLVGDPEESRRLGSRLGLKDGVEVEGVEVGRNEGASDTLDGTVGVRVVRGYTVGAVLAWSMSLGNPEFCSFVVSFFFDFDKTNPSERDTMQMTANVIPRYHLRWR